MVIGVDFVDLGSEPIKAWLNACVCCGPSLQGRRRYGCAVDCNEPKFDLPVFETPTSSSSYSSAPRISTAFEDFVERGCRHQPAGWRWNRLSPSVHLGVEQPSLRIMDEIYRRHFRALSFERKGQCSNLTQDLIMA